MNFTAFAKSFFGLLPGQTLQGFARELSALSWPEKCQLAADARLAGHDVKDPAAPAQPPTA